MQRDQNSAAVVLINAHTPGTGVAARPETRASVLATIQAEVSDPRNHYYNRSRGLVVREIHYEVTWPTFPTIAEQDTFLVAWIALLESRELILGGEPTSDFICGYRKSPTLLTSTRFTSF
jgi:hypothetical protein